MPRVSVKWTVPVFIFIFSGVAYAGIYSFTHHRLLFDLAYPLGAGLLIYVQLMFNNFAREFRLKQQIKKQFGTYLSPDMVSILQKKPELLKLGGETKKLTIMFSDIRGLHQSVNNTRQTPQGLTTLINRFLTPMTDPPDG